MSSLDIQIGKIRLDLGNKRYLLEQCWKVKKNIPQVCRKICTINCNILHYRICSVMVRDWNIITLQFCSYQILTESHRIDFHIFCYQQKSSGRWKIWNNGILNLIHLSIISIWRNFATFFKQFGRWKGMYCYVFRRGTGFNCRFVPGQFQGLGRTEINIHVFTDY
jgi:hypothetical protein